MRVKVSGANGLNKVVTLDNGSTLQDLIDSTEVSVPIIAVRFGYPVVKIDITDDNGDLTLDDLGISSGEKITVITKVENENKPVVKPIETKKLNSSQAIIQLSNGSEEILQIHKVPDDNSCLFHAISYCMYKDISLSYELRKVVSKEILKNPILYSEVMLEKPNKEYAEWILDKNSWGGAIDIGILSKSMGTAVYVIDMDAIKIEKFNEDEFDEFIIIMFTGIHYDAIELGNSTTVFNKTNELFSNLVLSGALKIAEQMKNEGYSFNTQKDKILCNVCKKILIGEREVAKHAESTGHVDFGQAN